MAIPAICHTHCRADAHCHFHVDVHPSLKVCEFLFLALHLILTYLRIVHLWLPKTVSVLTKPTDTEHGRKHWRMVAHVVTALAWFLALFGLGQLALSQAMPGHSWVLAWAKDDSQLTVWGYFGGLYWYVHAWLLKEMECALALSSWSAKT